MPRVSQAEFMRMCAAGLGDTKRADDLTLDTSMESEENKDMNTAAHPTKENSMPNCRHHSCTKPAVNTIDHGWCVLQLCQKHTQIMARIIISNKFNLTITPLAD